VAADSSQADGEDNLLLNDAPRSEASPTWAQRLKVHNEAHLRELLEGDDVDLTNWGVGKAKSVKQLFGELEEGSCFLERPGGGGKIRRVVEPVFIQIIWRGRFVLVNTVQQLDDGRKRDRYMFLAEKREPRDDGSLAGTADGVWDTAIRGMAAELNIPQSDLLAKDVLRLREDEYVCSELQKDSFSYPGIPGIYRNHYILLDILNTPVALETFKSCGLPNGEDFVSVEKHKLGERKNFWSWIPLEKAMKDNIKEFPPRDETKLMRRQSKGESGMFTRKLRVNSVAELVVLLEAEGLDLSQFDGNDAKPVSALYKEIKDGMCHLENSLCGNGAIRRVVEPVFVQLLWKGKVLVNTKQVLSNGNCRDKHMLLAKKKRPGDIKGVRGKDDVNGGGVWDTCIRAISEELGIPLQSLTSPGVLYCNEQSHFCSEMSAICFSYPGLYCLYRTHYVAVDIMDSKEAAQVFKNLGIPQGNAFQTLEEHPVDGLRTNHWTWMELRDAITQRVKEFPPEVKNRVESLSTNFKKNRVDVMSIEELIKLLEDEGCDTELFGQGQAKTVRALYHELMEGSCVLEKPHSTGPLQRIVEPVFVELRFKDKVLLNTKQTLEDGRTRERNMLLAEKKHPRDDGSLTKREGCWDAALRGIGEELGLPLESLLQPGILNLNQTEYAQSTLIKDSFSYPGVPCVYRNHYVVYEILQTEAAVQVFSGCGLPDFRPFDTMEKHRLGQRTNCWEWVGRDRAKEEFTKRMYPSLHQ
jgi:hypothetical protein